MLCAATASAHVTVERKSLRTRLAEAECVLLVEVRGGLQHWEAADASDRHEFYTVRVLEVLKGDPGSADLEFAPRAEGLPRYASGNRALLFLARPDERAESAAFARRFQWVSDQRPGEEWTLQSHERTAAIALARSILAADGLPASQRHAGRRAALLAALDSDSPLLQRDAITDLMAAHDDPALFANPSDIAPFTERAGDPDLPLAVRLPLLRLLHGRAGFDGDAALLALAQQPLAPGELRGVVQMASASWDPALCAWLAGLLDAPDADVRLLAARTLTRPWHRPYASRLARLVREDDPLLARAALQSLAALGGEPARAALEGALAFENRKLRDVAAAGLRRLDARTAASH